VISKTFDYPEIEPFQPAAVELLFELEEAGLHAAEIC
jgi:hypothetical protein